MPEEASRLIGLHHGYVDLAWCCLDLVSFSLYVRRHSQNNDNDRKMCPGCDDSNGLGDKMKISWVDQ